MSINLQKNLVFHAPLAQKYYNPATKRVTDLSPYSNHGTSANAASFVADRMGQSDRAMSFNGTSDNVRIPDSASLSPTSTMSAFVWVNGAAQNNRRIFVHSDETTNQIAFTISTDYTSPYDKFRLILSDNGTFGAGHKKGYTSSIVTFDSNWHHIGAIFNAGTLKLYVDGVEDTNPTKTYDDAITTIHNSNADIMVGCSLSSDTPTSFFTGDISKPRMYNRAITAAEALFLYESYNPKLAIGSLSKGLVLDQELNTTWYNPGAALVKDRSAYSNHGAVTGATVGAKWTTFNGTTDYVRIPDSVSLSPVNAMSAFIWVKGAVQNYKYFMSHWDTGVGQGAFGLVSTQTSPYNKFGVILTDNGLYTVGHKKNYDSSIIVFDSTPHQVGFTFDAGTLKLYVDGLEDTSPTKIQDDAITTIHPGTADVMMGCRTSSDTPGAFFTGDLAKPRTWNRAITPTEALLWFDQTRGLFL